MMEKVPLTENEILDLFAGLSHSQGFYGRLWSRLVEARDSEDKEEQEAYREFMDDLLSKKYSDLLDIIRYVEGG